MRRREFISLLGGAAVWPIAAKSQQSDRVPRIGVLRAAAENDPERQGFVAALREALRELGWAEGRGIRIETRWATPDDAESIQRLAKELVALEPDLILSHNTPTTAALLQHRSVPARRRLRRQRPEGREASRSARAGADQVRNDPQPQDRQGARHRGAGDAARSRL